MSRGPAEFRAAGAIAIVGIGARCAVGLQARTAAAAVRAGVTGFGDHPYAIDQAGDPIVVARDPILDVALQGPERFVALARPALFEALAPLAERGIGTTALPVMIGLPEPRPGLPECDAALAQLAAEVTRAALDGSRVTTLPRGNAAGLLAMRQARELLLAGQDRFCVAGGVDSYLSVDTLEWLDAQGMLKSSANRNGFLPGEAAGFCLLASAATAQAFELPVLAWLETAGRAVEASPIRTRTVCVGRGLSDAIEQALAPLRMPQDQVDESICDMNGEPYRSEEFAFTVLRTQKSFVDFSRFVTPADCWGDVGAASGPLFAGLAIASQLRGYAKGPRTMLWASSEGGDRAAVVLRASASVVAQGGSR